jgi:hypothetical protein
LPRQIRDLLGQFLVLTRQLGVRLEQIRQLVRLRLDRDDALLRKALRFVVMALLPIFGELVPVGLPRLREGSAARRKRPASRTRG